MAAPNPSPAPASEPGGRGRAARRWALPARCAVTVAAIGALAWIGDRDAVLETLAAVPPWSFAAACGLAFLQILLAGFRWFLVGRSAGAFADLRLAVRIVFVAIFGAQFLPTALAADAVRVALLARAGVPAARAVGAVALDRTAGLLSLLVLMAASAFALAGRLPPDWPVDALRALPLAGIAAIAGILFAGGRLASRLEGRGRLAVLAPPLRDAGRLARSGAAPAALGLGLAIYGAGAAAIWLLARGAGVEIGFLWVLGFLPVVVLATHLPVSIAGWGVREAAVVVLFGLVGIGSGEAFAVSVLWGAAVLAAAMLGGALWALTRPAGARPERGPRIGKRGRAGRFGDGDA